MRQIFIDVLYKEAKENKNFVLMVGDLGFSVVEKFQKKYPMRFFNAGVAEQNMTGMASGLASEGCQVFTYSILPMFPYKPLHTNQLKKQTKTKKN